MILLHINVWAEITLAVITTAAFTHRGASLWMLEDDEPQKSKHLIIHEE